MWSEIIQKKDIMNGESKENNNHFDQQVISMETFNVMKKNVNTVFQLLSIFVCVLHSTIAIVSWLCEIHMDKMSLTCCQPNTRSHLWRICDIHFILCFMNPNWTRWIKKKEYVEWMNGWKGIELVIVKSRMVSLEFHIDLVTQ